MKLHTIQIHVIYEELRKQKENSGDTESYNRVQGMEFVLKKLGLLPLFNDEVTVEFNPKYYDD